jgi:hypothetical protein
MNRFLFLSFFSFLCATSFSQFTNVLIIDINSPNEVSICINPKNTNQIVGGANLNNVYHSTDGGLTWSSELLTDPLNGVWGDPIIFTDTTGNFFYSHLSNPPQNGSWVDRIVFTKSTDGGITWWDEGTATGKNGAKVQDKEGVIVNQETNEIYVTWTQFDAYGSSNTLDSSYIMFSKSTDIGLTWSTPLRISKNAGNCEDDDLTVEGAIPTIGPNGEIYVVWTGANGFVMNKSLDNGATWLEEEVSVIDMPGGWNYNIGGLQRCNGLPQLVTDLSGGANHGTMYLNWTDQRNGSNDTDVWMIKSSDGGNTWSTLKRVNDDAVGKQQFLTWMTCDQTNGNLHFVFYDRRNYEFSNDSTDVYMAFSRDGGATISNYKVNENGFVPNPSTFFGDYTSVSAVNNNVRPIWMTYESTGMSVWTAIIDGQELGLLETKIENTSSLDLSQNKPNPYYQTTCIQFSLKEASKVSLKIYDVLGNVIAVLLDEEQYKSGKYDYVFNATTHKMSSGVYYYELSSGEYRTTKKMIVN